MALESAEYSARMAVNVARSAAFPRFDWLTGYRELLRTLLRREIRKRYKGSALGIVWSLVYPLAMMGVYTLVFSVLWRTAGNIPHYPLFVLTGLAVWGFFQAGVQLGTSSLIGNADLVKKVWFPRELIPAAAVLAQLTTSLVMFVILVPANLIAVPATAKTMALAFPIFGALVCLALGFAWLLSIVNVFFRDVEHLLAVLFLPWFFLTPVLYGLEQLPAAASHRWLIDVMRYGNPVTPYVEGFRATLLQATVPGASLLVYIFVVGPTLALLGLWVVQRYEDRLAVEL
ncbi:MAG: ABC transporter permease [Actinobacteria bacterium]|nr:MAG: ABC transporter permease [Actinomycetota bacterium]